MNENSAVVVIVAIVAVVALFSFSAKDDQKLVYDTVTGKGYLVSANQKIDPDLEWLSYTGASNVPVVGATSTINPEMFPK